MPAGSRTRKYEKGSRVMAKWPKTSLYFNGTVIDYNDSEYLIRFEDDDESELAVKFTQVINPFSRSSRSRSRGRSPAPKSPSRKSSPGRKKTTDKRKSSPGRPKKETVDKKPADRTKTPESRSRPRREIRPVEKFDSSPDFAKNAFERNSNATLRQSARVAAIYEKTVVDGTSNSIKVDAHSVASSVKVTSKISHYLIRFFHCFFATAKSLPMALIMIFCPLLLTQLCTMNVCKVLQYPDIPLKLRYYYNPIAYSIVAGFVLTQLLLALLPIGKVVTTRYGNKIRTNGILSLIVSIAAIAVSKLYGYDIQSVYSLYRPIMAGFAVFGFLFSVALYLKSFKSPKSSLNPTGNSGYFIPDFIEGREVAPSIQMIDVKFILFRICILLWIILTAVIALRNIQSNKGVFSPTVLVAASLQILYGLDLLWFEESYITSYEYLKQGCGMLTGVTYMTTPFIAAVYTRYLLNHRVELPWYCLVGACALYIVGYIILRGANTQKHAFRMNPSNPALSHLESLPTSTGRRLLVSGWWSLVRHPNYLGDLLTQLSWALICGFRHGVPWLVYAFSLLYLFGRIFQVEADCKKKYGLAWSSYISRVKYRLIPKVF